MNYQTVDRDKEGPTLDPGSGSRPWFVASSFTALPLPFLSLMRLKSDIEEEFRSGIDV